MAEERPEDYLFSDPRPERIDWFGMIPADVLAAHDREVAEKAWDEGHNAGWNEGVENAQGYFSQHDNPYREGSDG